MQVFDYKLQNKGAAVNGSSNEEDNTHLFTYIFADTKSKNLHVCCDQDNDEWITQRDNGETKSVDASIIAKFRSFSKPRA